MYKNVLGAKVKLVSGYPGTNDITLAMERGEVDGLCGISWSTIKSRHGDWISGKKINVPVQVAMHKDPESLIICNGYKDPAFIRIALLGCKLGKAIHSALAPSVFDRDITTFDPTERTQSLPERRDVLTVGRRHARAEKPDGGYPRALLRARRQRPRRSRPAEQRDEVAPP